MIIEIIEGMAQLTPHDKAALAMIFMTALAGGFIGSTLAVIALVKGK